MNYARPRLVTGLVASAWTMLAGCPGTEDAATATRAYPRYAIGSLRVILIVVAFTFWNGIGGEPKRTRRGRSSRGQAPRNGNEN